MLSKAEKDMYKKEHPQVAPDLRDGLVGQSEMTDIYSLGRIMKRCNSVIIHSMKLVNLYVVSLLIIVTIMDDDEIYCSSY